MSNKACPVHLTWWLLIASPLIGCSQSPSTAPLSVTVTRQADAPENEQLKAAMSAIDEFKTPGLECELSGIYPHPQDPDCYYVLANSKPPYRYGQKPMLAEEHRGKLLTVNRAGEVLHSIAITEDDFGGLEYANGHFYVALTNA